MDIKSVENVVSRLQRSLFRNANAISVGMMKTRFRGSGLQFKEHRIYSPGDETRFIDWKLLAKTGIPFVKTHEEERNLDIVVAVDVGPSMLTGDKGVPKLQAALEICCLLYLLAKKTSDRVHVIICSDQIHSLPPASGHEGIALLVGQLENLEILTKDGRVNIAWRPQGVLSESKRHVEFIKHLQKKREVVLLSDFQDFLSERSIRGILSRNNLHCIRITCTLDEGKKVPFSVWGHLSSESSSKGGRYFSAQGYATPDKIKSPWGQKMMILSVKGRYLEDFVQEIL